MTRVPLLFAVLIIEREPLKLADVPAMVQSWVLVAGGFAVAALVLWLLAQALAGLGPPGKRPERPWAAWLLTGLLGGVALAVVAGALPRLWTVLRWDAPGLKEPTRPLFQLTSPIVQSVDGALGQVVSRGLASTVAFGCFFLAAIGLVAAAVPMLHNVRKLRGRRIWALTRLTIKEAIRSRILWAFSFLLLIFLFGSWFISAKPEDQVRGYVTTVFVAMTVLLLITAGLLAAQSIPADLRRQTIHTIVTKPVERFEIVVGRFLGYMLLMSAVLAVMTFLSLIYVVRGVNEEARAESLKARVPVFGDLKVENGKSVGSEWGYRSYIGVNRRMDQQAIWTFHDLPGDIGNRDAVRLEYEFNIYRTTKGEEGKPVLCSFTFETARWDPNDTRRVQDYQAELDREYTNANRARLAEKYGYYQENYRKVENYHTLAVVVPGELFRSLAKNTPAGNDRPPLRITVKCQSPTQFIGVAKHDLYLLDRERSVQVNFFKGAAGIWFLLSLVVGLAVTCSTYLSGIISFLTAGFLILAGLWLPFIQDLAERKSIGGGPMEALVRLSRNQSVGYQLDKTPTVVVAENIDKIFSFGLRGVLYFFPDVKRFGLTEYVARGFDIPVGQLLFDNLLPLLGYLLPWTILAYYLIKSREIAS